MKGLPVTYWPTQESFNIFSGSGSYVTYLAIFHISTMILI